MCPQIPDDSIFHGIATHTALIGARTDLASDIPRELKRIRRGGYAEIRGLLFEAKHIQKYIQWDGNKFHLWLGFDLDTEEVIEVERKPGYILFLDGDPYSSAATYYENTFDREGNPVVDIVTTQDMTSALYTKLRDVAQQLWKCHKYYEVEDPDDQQELVLINGNDVIIFRSTGLLGGTANELLFMLWSIDF
jgi:hypothetical protein